MRGERKLSTAEELFKRDFPAYGGHSPCHRQGDIFDMETFFELCGFLYTTDLMRNAMQGNKLDECCHRREQKMNDVDAGRLKQEIIGAVRAFPPTCLIAIPNAGLCV